MCYKIIMPNKFRKAEEYNLSTYELTNYQHTKKLYKRNYTCSIEILVANKQKI